MISITRIAGLVTLLLVATSTLSQAQTWWSSSNDNKAFLGVESNRISKSKAEILNYDNRYGVLIDRIVANSGAEEAGLLPFDYIVAIDDEAMDWTTELTDLLAKYESGEEATIHYYRKNQKKQVRVTFGSPRSNSFSGNLFKKSLFQDEDPFLGVSESRYNDDEELGVAVNIVDGATADQMGLKDGDIIMSINDYKMIDWSDISRVMDVLEVDDKINIEYTREGTKYTKSDIIKSRPKRNYTINNLWSSNSSNSNSNAFLGIYSEELSKEKAERLGIENRYGSYVTSVFENSAAKNAGLQPFDYIYGIDEYRVGADQSLTNILRRYDAGEKAELHFIRQGKNYKYNITFGKRSAAIEPNKRSRCEDPFLGVQQNMRSSGEKGVRVDVVKKSTANALGMRSGDVIAQINGFPIINWADISPAIDMLEVGQAIKIDYYRAGQKMVTEGKIGSYCDTYGSGNSWSGMSIFSDDEEDVDVEDVSVKIAMLSSSNIQDLNREMDMDLSTDNSLKVNGLKISADGQLDIFSLQFALPNKGKTLIQIFNKQGRQIYTYDLGYFSGDFSDEVDLMQDGTGDYYLQISQDNKSLTQKVSVQNK